VLKAKEGKYLTEHINLFNQVTSDLGQLEVKVENNDSYILLLTSLRYKIWLVILLVAGIPSFTMILLSYDQRDKISVVNCDGESKGANLVIN
jgi:hypothetical protein